MLERYRGASQFWEFMLRSLHVRETEKLNLEHSVSIKGEKNENGACGIECFRSRGHGLMV